MKTLSVRQPWAWLIVSGYKDVENRTWRTSYRGPLLIHASQRVDREATEYYRREILRAGDEWPDTLVTGAIIGIVTLVDCVTECESPWFSGPIGWRLADAGEFLDPIPARGRLGLWEADIDESVFEEDGETDDAKTDEYPTQ